MNAPTLADIFKHYQVDSSSLVEVEHVYHNSEDVTSNSIFFALPGANQHGANFAKSAIANGAIAIFTDAAGEKLIDGEIPVVVVMDPRFEMSQVTKLVYWHQIADMHLWGITGTNGKTTTSYMLRALLPQPAAAIGTTGVVYPDHRETLARTTPEIDDLYRLLIKLRKDGIKKVVLEVSSHALVLHRVAGLEFQAVGFTNLTQDHLDFHKSMDEYLQAKARLFDGNYSKYAVVCVDSLSGKSIADLAEANGMVVSTVSTNDLSGTWSVTEKMVGITSLNSIINPIGLKLSLNFGGEFNFANALVAVAMADQVSEISQNQINALANLIIPGRMQVIAENGVQAIVDYAHSPAAIESVIQTLRQSVPGKLIVVIGAGGDRDKSKRAAMGSATVGADLVIVTDDNPRSEDPAVIRQQVIQGIESVGVTCQEIGDRREAIAAAVELVSSSNDLVAVLGKGHEQGQQIGDKVHDFDDYTELKFAIMNRGSHG